MSGFELFESLMTGSALLVSGLVILLRPSLHRDAALRDHQARLADRRDRGTDAYFEEQREIEAYPPSKNVATWRFLGLAAAGGGLFLIILSLTK